MTENYKYPFLKVILVWILLIIYLLLFFNGFFESIDKTVSQFFVSLRNTPNTSLAIMITFFGSTFGLVLVSLIVLVARLNKGLLLFIDLGLAYLFNNIIKLIVQRPRPTITHLVVETGYSFPSGHSMVSMSVFGLIVYYLWDKHKISAVILSLIPLLIGMTRIYLGVHYFSDVIAGFLFALTFLVTMIPLLKYHRILPIA